MWGETLRKERHTITQKKWVLGEEVDGGKRDEGREAIQTVPQVDPNGSKEEKRGGGRG